MPASVVQVDTFDGGNGSSSPRTKTITAQAGLSMIEVATFLQCDGAGDIVTAVTVNGVSATEITDANTGTAVGDGGTILRTTTGGVVSVEEEPNPTSHVPHQFVLGQNFPNPFNPSTTISYQVPTQSHVALMVFDVLGHNVATLVNDVKEPATYRVQFDGSGLASGVYFYRMHAGTYIETKKLLLLR